MSDEYQLRKDVDELYRQLVSSEDNSLNVITKEELEQLLNDYYDQSEIDGLGIDEKADKSEIPTKVSQLDNDAGYVTTSPDLSPYVLKSTIQDNLTSTDTDKPLSANQGKVLKGQVDSKVNTSDIKDNLTSTDTNKPLSANQGKELKTLVDGKAPINHKSTATTYGVADTSNYGHGKASNIVGEADTTNGDKGTVNGVFANANHSHKQSDLYAPKVHQHNATDVTYTDKTWYDDKVTESRNGKYYDADGNDITAGVSVRLDNELSKIQTKIDGKSDKGHTHDAEEISYHIGSKTYHGITEAIIDALNLQALYEDGKLGHGENPTPQEIFGENTSFGEFYNGSDFYMRLLHDLSENRVMSATATYSDTVANVQRWNIEYDSDEEYRLATYIGKHIVVVKPSQYIMSNLGYFTRGSNYQVVGFVGGCNPSQYAVFYFDGSKYYTLFVGSLDSHTHKSLEKTEITSGNLDNYTNTGWYSYSTSNSSKITNVPTQMGSVMEVLDDYGNGQYIVQKVYTLPPDKNSLIYYRAKYYNNGWGSWIRIDGRNNPNYWFSSDEYSIAPTSTSSKEVTYLDKIFTFKNNQNWTVTGEIKVTGLAVRFQIMDPKETVKNYVAVGKNSNGALTYWWATAYSSESSKTYSANDILADTWYPFSITKKGQNVTFSFNNNNSLTYSIDLSYFDTVEELTLNIFKYNVNGGSVRNVRVVTGHLSFGSEAGTIAEGNHTHNYLTTVTAHTDANGNYGKATTGVWGHTKLSSATNSTDETLSATPKAVKSAYDLANIYKTRYEGVHVSGASSVTKPYLRLFNGKMPTGSSQSGDFIFEIIGRAEIRSYVKILVKIRQNSATSGQVTCHVLECANFDLSKLYFAYKVQTQSVLDVFYNVTTYNDFICRIYDDHLRQGTLTQYKPVPNSTESYVTIEDAYTSLYGDGTYTTIKNDLTEQYVKTTDSRLSDARTPTSHAHGKLSNGGAINYDADAVNKIVVTDSANNLRTYSKLPLDKVTHQDISGKADEDHAHVASDVSYSPTSDWGEYQQVVSNVKNALDVLAGSTALQVPIDNVVEGSNNLVRSKGIYTALSGKADLNHTHDAPNLQLVQTITKNGATAKVYIDDRDVYIKYSGTATLTSKTNLNMGTVNEAYRPSTGYEYGLIGHADANIFGAVSSSGSLFIINRTTTTSTTIYGSIRYPLKSRMS